MAKENTKANKKETAITNTKPLFEKINYQIMLVGLTVILIGYIIMSMETAENGLGFLGLTLGPLFLIVGFALEFVAILYKPKKKDGVA
jgi:ABC-type transport system involved in cytochrome c biogenesis permease subunit